MYRIIICFLATTAYCMDYNQSEHCPVVGKFTIDIDPGIFEKRINRFQQKMLPTLSNLTPVYSLCPDHLYSSLQILFREFVQEKATIQTTIEEKKQNRQPIYQLDKKTTLQQMIEKKCAELSQELSSCQQYDKMASLQRHLYHCDYDAKDISIVQQATLILALTAFLDFVVVQKAPANEMASPFTAYHYYGVHLAAKEGKELFLRFLLDCGANLDIFDSKKQTPLDFVNSHDCPQTFKFLSELTAFKTDQNRPG